MIPLRPYQSDVVTAVERGWGEFRRQLIVMPTGSGKTIVFAHLAKRALPGRTLILAHREELIDQAIHKLHSATGIFSDKEKAEATASLAAQIVVASVQTMIRRLDRWPADHFSMVVADEAHHALSDSWRDVLDHFTGARILGVTATPDRGDKRDLGQFFENVAAEVGLLDLIGQQFLCPITIKAIPLRIDLTEVKSTAGDLDGGELGSALEPYLDQIAAAIAQHASFRRVLCFLPLIATSHKFVEACRAVGLGAEHVDGNSPDRREKLERFARWEFDVLSNAMLLTEGFDDPGIDCIVVLRPTRSRPLYVQMVGRGTRIATGKDGLLLLDFLWHHERHTLIRPAHLVAQSDDVADSMTRMSREASNGGGGEADLVGLLTQAQSEREDNLRKLLEANRRRKATVISAEEFVLQVHQPELIGWEPTMHWESEQITDKQAAVLRRAKIDVATVRGRGHASKLIDLVFREAKTTPATHKQKWVMKQNGYANWYHATQDDARKFFASMHKTNQ